MNIGTRIDGTVNQTSTVTAIEKYCYYNLESSCDTYGGLYQWNEAMQYVTTEGAQGICPTGWHIPTLAELQALGIAVGSSGNALKAIDQGTGSGVGTNTRGFSALISGYRYSSTGGFDYLGEVTYFWSSSGFTDGARFWLDRSIDAVYFDNYSKDGGIGISCLKD